MKKLSDLECSDSTCRTEHDPLVLERAEGAMIWDVEGKAYLDFCAGFGALALGHAADEIRQVLSKYTVASQIPILHGLGDVYPSRSKIELLDLLHSMLPAHLDKGMLALTGSQAVEMAAKTAMLYQKKYGFITFVSGYHGLDLGVLSFTDREEFRLPFKRFISEEQVIALPYGCQGGELEAAIDLLEARGFGAAALIVEPVQGRGGVIIPPATWLDELRQVTRKREVLMILDEVFTGLGRIGTISTSFSVAADLVCLGKALGGGFPISAVFGSREVMQAWPLNTGEAIHTGTFFGHPLSCDVAAAVLRSIKKSCLADRAFDLGNMARKLLEDHLKENPLVRQVRGAGLMIGIEFRQPGLGVLLMHRLRTAGLIAIACGPRGEGLSLTPSLVISQPELFDGLAILIRVINELAVDRAHP